MTSETMNSDMAEKELGKFYVLAGTTTFRLKVEIFMNRSSYFNEALRDYPLGVLQRGAVTIEAPDIGEGTFAYYKRCVETNDANIEAEQPPAPKITIERSPEIESSAATISNSNGGVKHDDKSDPTAEQHDVIVMKYCKGYYISTKLGDRATAALIIDALIDYSAETNSMLTNKHVQWILETLSRGCGLYKLAVDMWTFAAKFESFREKRDFDHLPRRFLVDVLQARMRAEAKGQGKLVEKAFAYEFIQQKKERYHGLSKGDMEGHDPGSDVGDGACTESSGDEWIMPSDEEVEEPKLSSDEEEKGTDGHDEGMHDEF